MKSTLFVLISVLIFLAACSESAVENNVENNVADIAATATTEPKAQSNEFSCDMISFENPAKAALDDPALRFDIDVPESFEIRKLTENELAIGYEAGARANPKLNMVSFGYQFNQTKAAQAVPQVMRDMFEKQGFEKTAVVSWNGELLDVYANRTYLNQADMKVWIPAETEGEFYAVSAKVFLKAEEECTAEITRAMTMFMSTMRPKESS